MTEFERMVNKGKFGRDTINVVVINLKNSDVFDASINAKNLAEVDSKLPEGYEMDRFLTLQNYFDHGVINEYEIELMNSQFIYFHSFGSLIEYGFYRYVEALINDKTDIINMLDRRYQFIKE